MNKIVYSEFKIQLCRPKDHIPDDDKSSIVYKINCRDCDVSYVGETGRALKTRVSEHHRAMEKRDFSASALAQHAWEHDHHIDWTSTCVLGVESHYQSRISREAIYICRQPSSLNTLSDMYDFIIPWLPFTISSQSHTTEGSKAIWTINPYL